MPAVSTATRDATGASLRGQIASNELPNALSQQHLPGKHTATLADGFLSVHDSLALLCERIVVKHTRVA